MAKSHYVTKIEKYQDDLKTAKVEGTAGAIFSSLAMSLLVLVANSDMDAFYTIIAAIGSSVSLTGGIVAMVDGLIGKYVYSQKIEELKEAKSEYRTR